MFSDLSMEHPWYTHTPVYLPEIVFLLYDGTVNHLPIEVISPDNILERIELAMSRYLRHVIHIDTQRKRVSRGKGS